MRPSPTAAFCFSALFSAAFAPAAPAADGIQTKTTYSAAYGKTNHAVALDPSKELPRYPAVAPADAVATWKVKPGFRMQLAASEPQVRDPVAICFDERGRMFVCEMIDYSEMRDATPHLGRVSVLEDRDGDGVYETGRVFADDIPWPTGIFWAKGGLFVAATPDIWRFEDRDGDGRAEVRDRVYTGFGTGLKILNVQGLLNSLQWGQDNRIHVLCGGGNRGEVSCLKRPELPPREIGGRDFWFDPLTYDFGLESGGAQYGMSFDDFGRKFGCSNSDHLQHWVYDAERHTPDPAWPLPPARQSVAADGGAAEVFRISPDEPWRIVRTRWRVSGAVPGAVEGGGRVSGYFTGATGTTVFRGDAYGAAFVNNTFTGDAGGQLVHRKVFQVSEDGVGVIGARPADELNFEFAASRDTWVRVVNFANAPDGCLYVCDMYREVIEHPWSIPDEIKQHLDLNSGNDRGRVYRIAPENGAARIGRPVTLGGESSEELVRTLAHSNGWHRDTAQRILHERQDRSVIPLLENLVRSGSGVSKLHALGVLEGLGALSENLLVEGLVSNEAAVRERALALLERLNPPLPPSSGLWAKAAALSADESPRVRFQLALALAGGFKRGGSPAMDAALLQLARRDHRHPWIGPALLAAPAPVVSRVLFDPLSKDAAFADKAAPFLARLFEVRAASVAAAGRAGLLELLAATHAAPEVLRAVSEGFRRAGTTLEKADKNGVLNPLFNAAAATAADRGASGPERISALQLLAVAPPATGGSAMMACMGAGQPDELQAGAVGILLGQAAEEGAKAVLAAWQGLGARARAAALRGLLAREPWTELLLAAVAGGKVDAAELSAAQIQSLVRSKSAKISALAKESLAAVLPQSRDVVVEKYKAAASTRGDAKRGHEVYAQKCLACHRAGGEGLQVGPDLVTVKTKGREALLTAILEPNKEVAAQYLVFTVQTKDDQSFSGFIAEDTADSVTLVMPGGVRQTVRRSNIKGTSSDGRSLMPEGMETGMSVEEMADLLTFIETLP
jgi:putative membrane-bound dehydrogenase-like protein